MSDINPAANQNFSWAHFDSEAYFQHYYGEPHPDDTVLIERTCAAFKALTPATGTLRTVDVGTGPSLIPLMCALPIASEMTAWEYSSSNVSWLKSELASDAVRPQWRHFWGIVRDFYGPQADLPANPMPVLAERAQVLQGSVFDLPERQWDAATMFFCAESITERRSEFEAACTRFARCVRPGGALVAAFLVGSSGYAVAERPFPVLNVSEADIREVFAPLSTDQQTQRIGIVEREIRSGYSGMVFMSARAA